MSSRVKKKSEIWRLGSGLRPLQLQLQRRGDVPARLFAFSPRLVQLHTTERNANGSMLLLNPSPVCLSSHSAASESADFTIQVFGFFSLELTELRSFNIAIEFSKYILECRTFK